MNVLEEVALGAGIMIGALAIALAKRLSCSAVDDTVDAVELDERYYDNTSPESGSAIENLRSLLAAVLP